jgi:tellurite resistance protein
MELKIGRDTLLALAAIAWADGAIDPREAEALRQASKHLQVQGQEFEDVERALRTRIGLDEVETLRMNRVTRLFTYATGYWMAEVDGEASAAESALLQLLGDRLGLSRVSRERAQNAVRGLTQRSASGSFDLLELRSRLSAGLSQIGDE